MATPRPDPSLWSRLKKARIVQVLLIYIGASWAVIQVTSTLQESLGLPDWLSPVAFILLLIGLLIVVATAWVQSHPLMDAREEAREVPGSWDLAVGELKQSVTAGRLPHLTWARAMIGGAVAFSLLFGIAGLYVLIQDRGRSFAPVELAADETAPAVAVLPFSVSGGELAVWREGMVDVLSTNLDGAAGLRAINPRTVLARWREAVPEGRDPELPTALSVARQTAASYGLVGSAVSLGRNVRLSAEVYELLGGRELGRAVAEGPQDSVLTLVDRLSVQVLSTVLRVGAGDLPALPNVASLTTTSLEALRAYLEGEALFRRSEFGRAIDAFERAVAADSTFALALSRIGSAYSWSVPGSPNIRVYFERALRFADRLPARETMILRGTVAKQTGLAGLDPLREAVRRYPDDAEAWYQLGDTYFHLGGQALLAPEEAMSALERAVELDPTFDPYAIHVVEWTVAHGDSAEAARLLEAQARVAPESDFHRASRLAFDVIFGEAIPQADATHALATVPFSVASVAAFLDLASARNLAARDLVLRAIRARPEVDSLLVGVFLNTLANRGKLRAAVAQADDRLLSASTGRLHLYALHAMGLLVEPNLLDPRLLGSRSAAALDDPSVMVAAAYAAERGRWPIFEEMLRGARAVAERVRQSGDSLSARRWDGLVAAIEGYGALKRGRPAEALEKLTLAQRGTIGGLSSFFWLEVNAMIRWWLAGLHLQMGQPLDAARYFHSLADWLGLWEAGLGSIAFFRLGQVYEELGDAPRSRDAYQEFLTAWQEADAELPQKAVAEQALARLGGP